MRGCGCKVMLIQGVIISLCHRCISTEWLWFYTQVAQLCLGSACNRATAAAGVSQRRVTKQIFRVCGTQRSTIQTHQKTGGCRLGGSANNSLASKMLKTRGCFLKGTRSQQLLPFLFITMHYVFIGFIKLWPAVNTVGVCSRV